METRRDFLKGLASGVLIGGVGAAYFFTDRSNLDSSGYSNRALKIDSLREDARRFVDYLDGKGFVYRFDLGGQDVEVNLSRDHFKERGNLLKYSARNKTVRVYGDGSIKVWEEDKQVTDLEKITASQIETDKVLAEIEKTNKKLFQAMLAGAGVPIDSNHFKR